MAWPAPISWAAVASAPNSKARCRIGRPGVAGRVTSNSRRAGSTDSCGRAGLGVAHLAVAGQQDQARGVGVDGARHAAAASRPSRSAHPTPARRCARRRPAESVRRRWIRRRARARPSGRGVRAPPPGRPGGRSMPSNSSATASAVTPRSASVAHTLRPGSGVAVGPGAHRARARRRRRARASMLAAKSRCCSSSLELHVVSLGSRGRPSSRSAMMLR